MIDRARWHGEIGYFDADGTRTGRELFSLSVHGDGARTLRAQCEMDDDALVRDAVLVLSPDGRPAEAFVRVVEGGTVRGTGWYRMGCGRVEADISEAGASPERRAVSLGDDGPRFFGTHSLVNDGWLARLADGLAPGSRRMLDDLVTCSLAANGGGVPDVHVTSATIEHVGAAVIEVGARAFACDHYRVGYGDYPPLDMWVSGPERLLVRMSWSHLGGRYELLGLTETLTFA